MLSVLLQFVVTIPSLLYFSDCCRYDINNFNRNSVFVVLTLQPWCNVYIEFAYQTLGSSLLITFQSQNCSITQGCYHV